MLVAVLVDGADLRLTLDLQHALILAGQQHVGDPRKGIAVHVGSSDLPEHFVNIQVKISLRLGLVSHGLKEAVHVEPLPGHTLCVRPAAHGHTRPYEFLRLIARELDRLTLYESRIHTRHIIRDRHGHAADTCIELLHLVHVHDKVAIDIFKIPKQLRHRQNNVLGALRQILAVHVRGTDLLLPLTVRQTVQTELIHIRDRVPVDLHISERVIGIVKDHQQNKIPQRSDILIGILMPVLRIIRTHEQERLRPAVNAIQLSGKIHQVHRRPKP